MWLIANQTGDIATKGNRARHFALYGSNNQPVAGLNKAIFKALNQQHQHNEQAFEAVKLFVHGRYFLPAAPGLSEPVCFVLTALQKLDLRAKEKSH